MNIVYTVLTGLYDTLRTPEWANSEFRFVCLTDRTLPTIPGWDQHLVLSQQTDPIRLARQMKITPHKFCPLFERASNLIYVDANIMPVGDLRNVISQLPTASSIGLYPHRKRDCVFQEFEVCKAMKLDEPRSFLNAGRLIQSSGYVPHSGLHETGFIVSRNDPAVIQFRERWAYFVSRGSRRDQLSFDIVPKDSVTIVDLSPGDVGVNPYTRYHKHQKMLSHTGVREWE